MIKKMDIKNSKNNTETRNETDVSLCLDLYIV